MKKFTIAGIALLAAGIGLAATNPSPERYAEAAAEHMSQELQSAACKDLSPSFLQTACQTAIGQAQPALKQLVLRNTQRQNFGLFSLYHTKLSLSELVPPPLGDRLPTQEFEAIGIGLIFIPYRMERKS